MTRRRRAGCLIAAGPLLAAVFATLLPGSGTPGPQFRVNTLFDATPTDPAVATNATGASIAVWEASGVYFRRYDASGGARDPQQILVAADGLDPAVGIDANGGFVVAWIAPEAEQFCAPPFPCVSIESQGVFARRFNPDGTPFGPVFGVHTGTGDQFEPAVAMNADGALVIAATSRTFSFQSVAPEPGILVASYAPDGTVAGAARAAVSTDFEEHTEPAVAVDPQGRFVLAWATRPSPSFTWEVRARLFDSTVAPLGVQIVVNATNDARRPAAGIDQTGNFVVAWETSSSTIRAQRFGVSGERLGSEFQVNSFSVFGERPAVGMSAGGAFVITGLFDDGEDPHVFAQCYGPDGTPQGDEALVNDPSTGVTTRRRPAAGMDADGNFLIAWTGFDASGEGIFARRYTAVAAGPSLSIDDVTVVEGDSGSAEAIFTVTLSASGTSPVSVTFATADGTAESDAGDYQSASGMVTFAAGETTKQISVFAYGDTISEPSETFFVNLGNAANAAILRGRGIGTIANDDFTVSVGDAVVTEGDAATVAAVFTVSLSGPSTLPVTVDFATADGTATVADSDYVGGAGTVSFAPGETARQVTVLIHGDARNEFDETLFVDLSNPVHAAIADGRGAGAIRNDDFGFTVAGSQFQVNTTFFGNQFQPAIGMNADGAFVIAWTGAVTDAGGFITGTGIFARRFDAGGIVQGPDFRVDDPALVFGQQTKPAVGMDAAGDFIVAWNGGNVTASATDPEAICEPCNIYGQRFDAQGNRVGANFQVNVSTPAGTLRDHPSVGMSASGEFVVAWGAFGAAPPLGGGTGIFARSFDSTGNPAASELQVDTFTPSRPRNPSVAVNPSECVIPPGTPPGACAGPGQFIVVWQGEGLGDSAGIFARRFDGGIPVGNQFRVNLHVDNVQERPSVGMDAAGGFVVAWEGEGVAFPGGPAVRGVFAQRFDPSGAAQGWCNPLPPGPVVCPLGELLVNAQTTNAHRPAVGHGPNGDFVISWDGLAAAAGPNSAIFARIFDGFGIARGGDEFLVNQAFPLGDFDPDVRRDRRGDFVVAWVGGDFSLSGVAARRFAATPTLSIGDFSATEGDSGTVNFTFPVTLSAAVERNVTVDFVFADGTATAAGDDYAPGSGTLVFLPGETSKAITVTVNGDTAIEPDETMRVDLGNPVNALIGIAQGVGTILNDDCAVFIDDVEVTEGDSGVVSAAFTVSLPCVNTRIVSVDFATADDTAATADNDYQAQSGTLTFSPGENGKDIAIVVNGDTTIEPDETFSVELGNVTGAVIGKARGVGTIVNDDVLRITVNETITITDAPGTLPSALIAVAETIRVVDSSGARPSALIDVAETIVVADTTGTLPPALFGVAETITVTDAPFGGNTAAGLNITVIPLDPVLLLSPVTITFDNVTRPGQTSLVISDVGPPPPSGLAPGDPPRYFDVTTTAVFSGAAEVCVSYAGIHFERTPSLWHFENGVWVDVTTRVDTTNQIVCGRVTSLSPFALLQPTAGCAVTVTLEGLLSPLAALVPEGQPAPLPSRAFKTGGTLPMKLRLLCGATVLGDADVAPPMIVALARDGAPLEMDALDLDSGAANDHGVLFRFSDGLWIYNLGTRELTSGSYVVTLQAPDGRRFNARFILR